MDHGKAVGSMVKRKKEGEVMTGGPTPKTEMAKPKMASKPKRGRRRMQKGHGGEHKSRSMYMGGSEVRMGMTHGGAHAANPAPAQPTYGSTVADAMPKAGPV